MPVNKKYLFDLVCFSCDFAVILVHDFIVAIQKSKSFRTANSGRSWLAGKVAEVTVTHQ